MLILKNCCCFNIRTCGVIIGWLGLIGGIIIILNGLLGLGRIDESVESLKEFEIDPEDLREMVESGFKYMLFDGVIKVLTYSLLLWGINQNNKLGLIPWLITSMIKIITCTFVIIVTGSYLYFTKYPWVGFGIHCVGFLIEALSIYFWCCILSIYNQIKLQETVVINARIEEGRILTKSASPISMTNTLAPPPYKSLVNE